MTDGVPLEVGVAIVGGEGVDDVRAVVVDAAAAVGLCKFSCNTVGNISTPTLTHLAKKIAEERERTQLVIIIGHVSSPTPQGPGISETSF